MGSKNKLVAVKRIVCELSSLACLVYISTNKLTYNMNAYKDIHCILYMFYCLLYFWGLCKLGIAIAVDCNISVSGE